VLGAALKHAHLLLCVKVEGVVVSHRLALGLEVNFSACHSVAILFLVVVIVVFQGQN
jgi:hypothetical protein